MRRIFIIVILACISFAANAEQITYSQVANASSIKEFKKMKITSYKASNGEEFSVGGTLTIGPKSDILYHCVVTLFDLNGCQAEIDKISIEKNKRDDSFMVALQLRVDGGQKMPFKTKVVHLERAISIGEVVSEIGPVVITESESLMSSVASGVSQYTLSNGTNLVVDTTEVEIMHTADWGYKTLSCDTQKGGMVCKLAIIDVQTKGRNKSVVKLVLQTPSGERIIVRDAEAAIKLGEIYIVQ